MMTLIPFEYAVRNLGRSRLRMVASIVGAGLVVLLVLTAGAFVRGMQSSLIRADGEHQNVILLGAGSEESIERSQIDQSVASIVQASVQGIRSELSVAFVSPEVHVGLPVRESRTGTRDLIAILRGIEPAAFLVHPEVQIIDGHAPRTAMDEVMIGGLAAVRMGVPDERLTVGQTIWFDNREWRISGRFTAPGTVMDAEVWVPLRDLQIATKRDTLSCVIVTLGTASVRQVDAFARTRLDLELVAIPEREYYQSIAEFYRPVQVMVWTTAALIGLGGLLGGLNTMYAAFASRVREVGMLQALGFTRTAIVVSLMQESLVAACAGAIVACIIGQLLLPGVGVRFSMGAFRLVVDPSVLVAGLTAGLCVGLLGALPPAWRCLRLPITGALKG